jgi:hypothetical protein
MPRKKAYAISIKISSAWNRNALYHRAVNLAMQNRDVAVIVPIEVPLSRSAVTYVSEKEFDMVTESILLLSPPA